MQSLQSAPRLSSLAYAMLQTICEYPGLTSVQLNALVHRPSLSMRSVRAGLSDLRALGFLRSGRIPESKRSFYVPTRRALYAHPELDARHSGSITSTAIPALIRGTQRAQLTIALEAEGYTVSRSNVALAALRDYLVRESAPLLRPAIEDALQLEDSSGRDRKSVV